MSLDITKISAQIGDMVATLKCSNQENSDHLKSAIDKLSDSKLNLDKLKRKIADSRTTAQAGGRIGRQS
jgi:hypothetical protein